MPGTEPKNRPTPSRGARTRSRIAEQQSGGDDKYAVTTWGQNGVGSIEDLTVPSGQLCAVRRPGLEGLMKEGILTNFDTLTSLVETEHVDRVKKGKSSKVAAKDENTVDAEAIGQLLKDPAKFAEMVHTIDRVVCAVVVKPEVQMTPNDITRRERGVIYADMVDLDDKMFIFNYALGGTRDLEQFRQEFETAVGSVDAGEAVADPA